ncbi:MAG: Smr/MutS family protein [Mailhella sp.]|nr:Smr/MutS family protein [Mailhella sp.]
MEERSLRALEFFRVLEALAGRCRSEAGKRSALALRPLNDLNAIRRRQRVYDETQSWLAEADQPLTDFPDISGIIGYLESHAAPLLDMDALWALRETLTLAKKLRLNIHEGAARRPMLDAMACEQPMPELSASALFRCLGDDGSLKDESSPGLLLVRGEIRSIHQNCLRRVREFSEKYNIAHYLQDEYMTLSSDRYVLPLKANFKGRMQGIIHDYSKTGETIYFEPLFLVEQNNRLQELKRQEHDEEQQILRMITGLLVQELSLVRAAWDFLVRLDLVQAACSMGSDFNGHCVSIEENCAAILPGARHPLLALESVRKELDRSYSGPRRVQPVDILFRDGDHALVISGGNAGGKTVALKTLGLITLMTLTGLPAPSNGGSRLPFWNDVLAFIGDEQSIDDHVSTFTGQIRHLSEAWDRLDGRALVLLDEFGAGTDPAQGAALAQAVLDGLLEKGAFTMAATHFPALKSYALTREGVRAASMLFDSRTKKPLFQIAYDQVGSSQALDVAHEHGMPESILARAEHYLLMDGSDATLIMDRLNGLAARREDELSALREQQRLLAERKKVLQEKMEKARAVLEEDLRRMSRELMQEYRNGKVTARQAHKELARLRAQIAPAVAEDEKPAPVAAQFSVGGEATHRLWNKKAVVRQIDEKNGKVKIDMGGVTLWAPLSDLMPGSCAASAPRAVSSAKISAPEASLRLDLRGKRADLALAELERFLDRSLLAGAGSVDVIHGRGTGALRKAVHDLLKSFPGVASFQCAPEGQGGDGVTQVVFR